jgi:hypothetical protein
MTAQDGWRDGSKPMLVRILSLHSDLLQQKSSEWADLVSAHLELPGMRIDHDLLRS